MTMKTVDKHRSWQMSRIKSKDTKPEIIVRSTLHKLGYRFRLHRAGLPGKPDIVLSSHRKIIFVHGCFWHQHTGCRRSRQPKSNQAYWQPKFERNIARFKEVSSELKEMGWKIKVIWECETFKKEKLSAKLKKFLAKI